MPLINTSIKSNWSLFRIHNLSIEFVSFGDIESIAATATIITKNAILNFFSTHFAHLFIYTVIIIGLKVL